MARILSGTELSSTMRAEIADEAARFQRETGVRPGLATILVGDDPASQIYVRMKGRAADAAGFYSRSIVLPGDTSHQRLLGVIDGLNVDPEIHGILVQLPLPKQIRTDEVLLRIDPAKDVDAFHPMNMGRLASGDREVLAPCTPAGAPPAQRLRSRRQARRHRRPLEHRRPSARAVAAPDGQRRGRDRHGGPQPHAGPGGGDA